METGNATPPPAPGAARPPHPVEVTLTEFLGRARFGEFTAIVIGFIKADGGAAVQSTPMSPVMMNHLSKLLERRVSREYDRALAQNVARSGTGAGAVPEAPRTSPAVTLPRKVRRSVKRKQNKLQALAEKNANKKNTDSTQV